MMPQAPAMPSAPKTISNPTGDLVGAGVGVAVGGCGFKVAYSWTVSPEAGKLVTGAV